MSAFDRRSILLGGATLVGASLVAPALTGCPPSASDAHGADAGKSEPSGDGAMNLADVLPILVAVADRMMPSDDLGPGAKDAGIEAFLGRTLADPRMRAIKSICTRGAVFLGRAAKKEHGKAFVELSTQLHDAYVTRLARNEVRPQGFSPQAFVRVMLALTLEGFLGDPRHGGNKDEVGWKFIGGVNWAGRG
jgi:gluconate 2-dehydrogenase gamma chain